MLGVLGRAGGFEMPSHILWVPVKMHEIFGRHLTFTLNFNRSLFNASVKILFLGSKGNLQ